MKTLLTLALCLATLLPTGTLLSAETLRISSGEQQVNLVELYTSEGCSSCPPAEAWLNRFVDDDLLWKERIPLAFHVDYWDYIGWRDRFAQAHFSERQYRYAKEGAIRTVYTPGVLLNGQEWRGWSRQSPVRLEQRPGNLSLEVTDDQVQARFEPTGKPPGALRLQLAVLGFGLGSEVGAGENRGRQLAHEFVVVGLSSSDSTDLTWQTVLPEIKPTAANRYALVGWVSELGSQRPLQAAGGWLPNIPAQ